MWLADLLIYYFGLESFYLTYMNLESQCCPPVFSGLLIFCEDAPDHTEPP